ncbi:MAG TPA: HDOD domain-containing protein [Solirubrobacteraceae bacterium]|jgi:HD-like signal output (HDOD) protein/DNA-binding CsgD family transcriptional regulator|nr:HDOD domain-containing protein [Solirubrobacteraceae bacterium]
MNHGVPSKHASPNGGHLAVSQRPVARPGPRSKADQRPAHAGASSAIARTPPQRPERRGRLTLAFEALDTFPALAEARKRLLSVTATDLHATADVISAVESDMALTIAVLRLANSKQTTRGGVDTVASAVLLLRPHAIRAVANHVRTFDYFGRADIWKGAPERFRLHALATQYAADRIACAAGYASRDRLAVTSLMHDVGKLVLIHAYPGYPSQIHRGGTTPEQRVDQELRELGVDHALVAGVLIRRWGLPASVAIPIERHHSPEAEGEAQIIRLADMLANYELGARVSPSAMLQSARAIGLSPDKLRWLMHEPPGHGQRRRRRPASPLSPQELVVLQRLAKGSVYNQIAHDLTLTASTIRSHLHNIYRKLDVPDRAQAVLVANERGWL